MAWFEVFSRESSEASALVCDNDPQLVGATCYRVSISTSSSTDIDVAPGIYRVWLEGRDPTVSVYLRVSIDSDPAVEPDGSGANVIAFAGDMTVRIRIPPAAPFDDEDGWAAQKVKALASSGASSPHLFFVPLLKWVDE